MSEQGAVATAERTDSASSDPEVLTNQVPRSVEIASSGVRTGSQFSQLMSALMGDLIQGSVTPSVGNAVVNAGGKMLKVVELQLKYGKASHVGPTLELFQEPQQA